MHLLCGKNFGNSLSVAKITENNSGLIKLLLSCLKVLETYFKIADSYFYHNAWENQRKPLGDN